MAKRRAVKKRATKKKAVKKRTNKRKEVKKKAAKKTRASYYCRRCKSRHFSSSKIGRAHKKK